MKSLGDDAFDRFDKKEELISFLTNKLPNISKREVMALAKTIAYMREKKEEKR